MKQRRSRYRCQVWMRGARGCAAHQCMRGCFLQRSAHCALQCRNANGLQRYVRATIEAAPRLRHTQLQWRACSKSSTAKKLDATTAAAITRRCMPQAAEPPFARLLSSARRRRIRRRVAVRYRTSVHYAQWLHALCAVSLPEAVHASSRPLRRLRRRHHQARHARCGSRRRQQRRFIYAQRLTVKVIRSHQSRRGETGEARRVKPAKTVSVSSTRTATFARRRRPVRTMRPGFAAPRPRRR